MPVVMSAEQVGRSITRIAHEIVERHHTMAELALIGIRTRGVPIARRLAETLAEITGSTVPTGAKLRSLGEGGALSNPPSSGTSPPAA